MLNTNTNTNTDTQVPMQVEKEEETNIQIEEKLPGILKNETKKKFSLMEEGGGLTELGHEKQP